MEATVSAPSYQSSPSEPEVQDFFIEKREHVAYQRGDQLFQIRKLNFKGRDKYSLDLKAPNGKAIGYIAFFYYQETGELVFSGIKVEQPFRQQGFSYVLLDELQSIATQNHLRFERTKKQKKPLTCAVLRKAGFDPINGLHKQNRVFVGRLLNGKRGTGVFFESLDRAARFEGSKMQRVQRCEVVLEREEIAENATQIVFPASYIRREIRQELSRRPSVTRACPKPSTETPAILR